MYDTLGYVYRLWRLLVLEQLMWVIERRPGKFGLAPPPRGALGTQEQEERIWWEDNLYTLIRRTLSLGFGRIVRILVQLGVPLLILLLVWVNSWQKLWPVYALIPVTLVLFYSAVVGTCYAAYVSLRGQPADRYAEIVLAGKPATEIFQVVAWEIRTAAACFLLKTEPLHKNLPPLDDLQETSDVGSVVELLAPQHDLLLEQLKSLREAEADFQKEMQRLLELKLRAAEMLGIDARRLCDHIVQYSPILHGVFLAKYIANWNYILTVIVHDMDKHVSDRVKALARENHRMVHSVRLRYRHQTELFHNTDLHSFIHDIGGQQSMSDATLAYTRAVSHIASNPDIDTIPKRLRFLHRKQQVYPGFDLHLTAIQLCKCVSGLAPDSHEAKRAQRQLGWLKRIASDGEEWWPTKEDVVQDVIIDLRHLAITAETYFDQSRMAAAVRFGKLAKSWFGGSKDPKAPWAIVLFDYSKSAREAVKTGLQDVGRERHTEGREHPLVCVLVGQGHREASAVRMAHEVTEDTDFPRTIAIGDVFQVTSILGNKSRVMVVLGVEAFDDHGTVVHWQGALRNLDALRLMFNGREENLCVVAIAADYKRSEVPLDRVRTLLRYHLRHVDVSHRRCDFLVTDSAITGSKKLTPYSSEPEIDVSSWPGDKSKDDGASN